MFNFFSKHWGPEIQWLKVSGRFLSEMNRDMKIWVEYI